GHDAADDHDAGTAAHRFVFASQAGRQRHRRSTAAARARAARLQPRQGRRLLRPGYRERGQEVPAGAQPRRGRNRRLEDARSTEERAPVTVAIALEGVTKNFGGHRAVDNVSLEIAEGEFFSLLGPSGCGKTTSLRMIAGFELPDSGRVLLGG